MTALIPAAVTAFLFVMVHQWCGVVEPRGMSDPLGTLLVVGAYLVAFLLSAIVWLAWLLFVVLE